MVKLDLPAEIEQLAARTGNRNKFLLDVAKAINRRFPHYTWVGYYFLEEGKLHIGPYIGKPTPHTVIELDRGICGAAVTKQQTVVVADVNADPRYLACSLETRSEIVIPLRVKGEIVGELDVDSDRLAAFQPRDRALLEQVALIIGRFLEQ
jgi:L-methionine (R)-S-oxide reductase